LEGQLLRVEEYLAELQCKLLQLAGELQSLAVEVPPRRGRHSVVEQPAPARRLAGEQHPQLAEDPFLVAEVLVADF